ncbi:MAG: hypothetical protein WD645_02000 [Dehalococcoidia bacterium]
MAQEFRAASIPWWEMPVLPRRPQYLQVQLMLREQQPSGAARMAELTLLPK